MDPPEFQVGLLQDQDGTADSLGQVLRAHRRWQRALGGATQVSGLLHVLTPALGPWLLWSQGVNAGQPRPGNLADGGASHVGGRHCPPPWPHLGKPAWGPGSGEGRWGLGLHTSMHPHFLSSSWSFSDNGDRPGTAEAGGAVTGSNQTPGSAGQTQVTRQVTQTPWASACPSVKWEDDSTYHTALRAFNVFRYIKHLERCWVHCRCSVNITYCS